MLILDLLDEMDIKTNEDSEYMYNGVIVPRTTHILSSMLHEDKLMGWANYLGLYKRTKYKDYMDMSTYIGTNAHNFMEEYIKNQEYDITKLDTNNINRIMKIRNCVDSFILWYDDLIKDKNVEILGIEQKLSCPWFGGTYDLLLKVNDRIVLVDFKTSNHVTYRYFLQLAAYGYMLSLNNIFIDSCLILQVNKNTPAFNVFELDLHNEIHNNFFENCKTTYFSLVYAYYNKINVEKQFNKIFKNKKGKL